MIRVGLVGYGLAGAVFHAPLIRACSRMELAAVLTSRDVPRAVRSLDELLERCELVVVASPNATHFAIAKAALEAGKHVIVDKPFTVTVAEADELIGLAERLERKLTVFQNRRWDGDFLSVRSALPQLGAVRLFEAHWDRFRPAIKQGWKEQPDEGTGLLNDLGPHLIDQALQLFGMPDALLGDIALQRDDAQVDDYFELTLHYGRTRALLGASSLIADPRPRFAVHGTAASFVSHGVDPQEDQLKAGIDPRSAEFGQDKRSAILAHGGGSREELPIRAGCYVEFYEEVAGALLDGGAMPVDPSSARDVMHVIALARRSSREGRRIDLSNAVSEASD